jgi:hypothetical protein
MGSQPLPWPLRVLRLELLHRLLALRLLLEPVLLPPPMQVHQQMPVPIPALPP